MPDFKVAWVIDVDADSPQDAARQALEIMREPDSIATVLTVTDDQGKSADVDLLRQERDPRVQAIIDRVLAAESKAMERNTTFQYRMDDLIYEHCGTSKKWSNVNNQGIEAQIKILVDRLGVEEAIAVIEEAIAKPHDEEPRVSFYRK